MEPFGALGNTQGLLEGTFTWPQADSCSSRNPTPQISANHNATNSASQTDQTKATYAKNSASPDFNSGDLLASMKQGVDHAFGKITARTHQLTKRVEVSTLDCNRMPREAFF